LALLLYLFRSCKCSLNRISLDRMASLLKSQIAGTAVLRRKRAALAKF